MSDERVIEVLKSALKLIHEEHIGRLIAIPQPLLEPINPNRGLPLHDILKQYNKEVGEEICITVPPYHLPELFLRLW